MQDPGAHPVKLGGYTSQVYLATPSSAEGDSWCSAEAVPDSKVHGAHLGPVGLRWAPCWPQEPCYQGVQGSNLGGWGPRNPAGGKHQQTAKQGCGWSQAWGLGRWWLTLLIPLSSLPTSLLHGFNQTWSLGHVNNVWSSSQSSQSHGKATSVGPIRSGRWSSTQTYSSDGVLFLI